jgi:ACS family pantothenate transporter-like MFS transporter
MRHESAMFRGIVLAGMNTGSNTINAWWSIVFYGASMAPWFIVSFYHSMLTSLDRALTFH